MCSLLRCLSPVFPFVLFLLVCRLLHTMQLCVSLAGRRVELRITSVVLSMEYRLAWGLAHVERTGARAEVLQLLGRKA
jgi:hypothetical protein